MAGFGFGNVGFVGSLRPATAGPAPAIVYDETSTQVTHAGPGTWVLQTFSDYIGGQGKYNSSTGAYVELTMPAGYTRLLVEGISNSAGNAFDVSVNGTFVVVGSCANANSSVPSVYLNLPGLAAGNVVRLTRTAGSGVLFSDQYTLTAS